MKAKASQWDADQVSLTRKVGRVKPSPTCIMASPRIALIALECWLSMIFSKVRFKPFRIML